MAPRPSPGLRRCCAAVALTLLLAGPPPARTGDADYDDDDAQDAGPGLQVAMEFYDFAWVRVTWRDPRAPGGRPARNLSFLYSYDADPEGPPGRPCPRYLLRDGVARGCELGGRRGLLRFLLRDGPREVLRRSWDPEERLRPAPPRNVTFAWRRDAVTVTCAGLDAPGLGYEVQYRSAFDAEWQSAEDRKCVIDVDRLDASKCYEFRARVRPLETFYGPLARASEWTEVTRWRGARPAASCQEDLASPWARVLAPALTVTAVLLALLLLLLWKLQRVKRLLLPCVPDPKLSFPGLFDKHHGNFQAWIAQVTPPAPAEAPDVEEALLVLHEAPSRPPGRPRAGPGDDAYVTV